MNIEINVGAKEWIEMRGNQLTVKTMEVKGCCAPGVQDVVAVQGRPKTVSNFQEYLIGDLVIYVQNTIRGKDKLELSLSGFSFLKSISAKLQ